MRWSIDIYAEEAGPDGLTQRQFAVLEAVAARSGLTQTDLVKATGLSASNITRYVATLEAAGFAERIPETGRIRPSVRLAQHAVGILRSLDAAKQRVDEIVHRLCTPQ